MLITCPECKRKVSDKAAACPNCGYPIAQEPAPEPEAEPGPEPETEPAQQSRGCGKPMLIAALVLIGIIALAVWNAAPRKTSMFLSDPNPSNDVMYACGIDLCKDSREYGKLVDATSISVWQGKDPNRGTTIRQLYHGQKVEVDDNVLVSIGPGGTWYHLVDGGWINDLWLTEYPCTKENIAQYSFTDCLEGKY